MKKIVHLVIIEILILYIGTLWQRDSHCTVWLHRLI